ncbi:hypothetical protein [Burkholderia metallica]|uniref:hypothetical protein n=1 Tax=Burkholderia metallica TaxID=488729 RepID=UPI001CF52D9A|nr:hypothetical protein [Burkholderia metallica]MCA8018084.1 hypothetical protein [Burkholderia metallica]
MNTIGLELPTRGVLSARFVDGMRECHAYNVINDEYIARWDTVINGEKRVIWATPLPACGADRSIDEWLLSGRIAAKESFEAEEKMLPIGPLPCISCGSKIQPCCGH